MTMIVTYNAFLETLKYDTPKSLWPEVLKAMWYDSKGNWKSAHDLVDGMDSATGKWVHAYLHRKEGDDWNAGYWYQRAGRPFPKITLEQEHQEITEFILNQ